MTPALMLPSEAVAAMFGMFRARRARRRNYAEYLKSPWWLRVREDALYRARHRCQLCSSAQALEVHHNTYDRLGREWPSDVIVLCRACHAKHHGRENGNA